MVKVTLFALWALVAAPKADDHGKADYNTGTKYFEAEEFDAALPYFRTAYEKSGRRPATVFALAQCERALKLYPEAITHFEENLASDPENKADVSETVRLLKEIDAKNQAQLAEKAKTKASEDRAAAEATQKKDAEARREAERRVAAERALAEERQKREAAEREAEASQREVEASRKAEASRAPGPPPPVLIAPAPPPPEEESSLIESPVFWIVTGALAVGGAVAAGVVLSQGSDGYDGTSHLIVRP
jgi:tetratricopeptide (TPR) repeat protein